MNDTKNLIIILRLLLLLLLLSLCKIKFQRAKKLNEKGKTHARNGTPLTRNQTKRACIAATGARTSISDTRYSIHVHGTRTPTLGIFPIPPPFSSLSPLIFLRLPSVSSSSLCSVVLPSARPFFLPPLSSIHRTVKRVETRHHCSTTANKNCSPFLRLNRQRFRRGDALKYYE